ncbi:MAG: LamG domain-containing protein, partial [Methanocorpusculum sp.]|nr:LamG domain-containing protein [Methanocorpusculum sp.]
MWIFPRENEPYQTIFRQEEDTYGTLGLDFRFIKYNDDEGYLYFGFNRQSTGWQNAFPWNDETSLANITKIPMNRWTHVALTKLGKNIILYANGTKYYEMTLDPKHYNAPAPSKGNTSIGGTTAVNQFFSGRMDEIQFWNTALNPAEIEAWMYRGIDSSHNKYNNLVYYYKLNQSSGTTVIDSKGSYNGTLVNMTDGSWVVSDVRGWTVDAGSTLEGRFIG